MEKNFEELTFSSSSNKSVHQGKKQLVSRGAIIHKRGRQNSMKKFFFCPIEKEKEREKRKEEPFRPIFTQRGIHRI